MSWLSWRVHIKSDRQIFFFDLNWQLWILVVGRGGRVAGICALFSIWSLARAWFPLLFISCLSVIWVMKWSFICDRLRFRGLVNILYWRLVGLSRKSWGRLSLMRLLRMCVGWIEILFLCFLIGLSLSRWKFACMWFLYIRSFRFSCMIPPGSLRFMIRLGTSL